MSKPVSLSVRDLNFLANIQDLKVRQQTQDDMLKRKALKQAENDAKWELVKAKRDARRNQPLEFTVTDAGYLVIKGTGTRRDAIISPERARAILKNITEFKAIVATLPESPKRFVKKGE